MSEALAQPVRRRPRWAPAALLRILAATAFLAMAGTAAAGLGDVGPLAAPAVRAAQESPPLDEPSVPTRISVPSLGIDLPVVSSQLRVRGNVRGYPLCDVAQYWTIYDLPGAPGTTWIYAHAQPGMFLPLLENTVASGGTGPLGKLVTLQLRDGRVLRYRIDQVKQHALDRSIARRDRPSEHRLILQTSEGPSGTIPKLQIAARLVGATMADERAPRARPRACSQPRRTSGQGRRPSASPTPAAGIDGESGGGLGSMSSLAIGGGAILLGATVFAVYLVRRPPAAARRRT